MTTSQGRSDVGRSIGSYASYAEAQTIVDTLSDRMFPVEHLAIIGRDLHLVEQVTGRLTARPPALAGAATGAWLGLFIGLVFWIVSPWGCGAMLSSLPLGIVFGAGWGAAVHLATGDRQHANSLRAMSASRYEIVVDAPYAADALRVLGSPEPV